MTPSNMLQKICEKLCMGNFNSQDPPPYNEVSSQQTDSETKQFSTKKWAVQSHFHATWLLKMNDSLCSNCSYRTCYESIFKETYWDNDFPSIERRRYPSEMSFNDSLFVFLTAHEIICQFKIPTLPAPCTNDLPRLSKLEKSRIKSVCEDHDNFHLVPNPSRELMFFTFTRKNFSSFKDTDFTPECQIMFALKNPEQAYQEVSKYVEACRILEIMKVKNVSLQKVVEVIGPQLQ